MNKNPLLIIFLTVFIDLVGFGIIIPLSPYLAREYGADPLVIGVLGAIYSVFQFIFSPIWGSLSDRIGRRPVLLVSVLGASIAHLIFGLADSLVILFLARSFAGIFGANISTALAYIADVTSEKDRSKSMGIVGAAIGLGFILGPVLGGLLPKPAFWAAGICFVNFLFTYFMLPESNKYLGKVRERKSRIKLLASYITAQKVGVFIFSYFLMQLALSTMEQMLFLFMYDRFGWSQKLSSYGFAYVGVVMVFTQGYLIRKMLPIFGERVLILVGPALFLSGMFLTGASMYVWLVALAMTLLAIGSGLFNPAINGTISLLTEKDHQGEVMGVSQSAAAMARVLGPFFGGLLYQNISMAAPFYFASGLAFIALCLLFSARKSTPQSSVNVG